MNREFERSRAATASRVLGAALVLNAPGLAQGQPQVEGLWETRPEILSINPVHGGLLRTGSVLVISGSGNDPKETTYRAAV